MVEFLINNVVSSIFSGLLGLGLILLIFKVFKVRDSRVRFFLLFAPMLRSLVVLMDPLAAIKASEAYSLMPIARLPDPFGLISAPSFLEVGELMYSKDLTAKVFAWSLIIIALAIIWRWIQLFALRYRLASGPEIAEEDSPELITRLKQLASKMRIKTPRFVLTEGEYPVPFTIGFFNPTIVLSNELLTEFSDQSLDAILAHELAHVKRFDTLTRWLATILKDIQFFNPAVRLAYKHLELEREVICDLMAADVIGTSPEFLSDVIKDVILFYRRKLGDKAEAAAMVTGFSTGKSDSAKTSTIPLTIEFQPLMRRMDVLSERRINAPGRNPAKWIAAAFFYPPIVLYQIGFYIKVFGQNLFIR